MNHLIRIKTDKIPSPEHHILPGVKYGRPDILLSPAYWKERCLSGQSKKIDFISREGTLEEELVFCLLGGFGVTLEIAEAFYFELKRSGKIKSKHPPSQNEIHHILTRPLLIGTSYRKYRFPKQRAHRIYQALSKLQTLNLDEDDPVNFRNELATLEGVGLKTASWITRNWLGANNVAILDIHVLRAGWLINLFDRKMEVSRDYIKLEKIFLDFAAALDVQSSILDAVIWSDMRLFGSRLSKDLTNA